jgi:glycosyltransferase involved in cell wall biosynthesis
MAGQKLTIGIDGRPFQGAKTGVGRYVSELCMRLHDLLPEARFIIYSHIPIQSPVDSPRWTVQVDGFFLSKRMKAIVWLKFRCGAMARKDKVDMFWGSATLLPPLPRKVKTFITIYDLNFMIVPESMVDTHRLAHHLLYRRDVLRATTTTAISQGTADRVRKYTGRTVDAVITPAANASFRPCGKEEVSACLQRLGIAHPFILAVATWEPRKNLELLIKVFLDLKKRGLLAEHKLVLAGGKGWKDERLSMLLEGGDKSNLLPLGFVADGDLPCLYTAADAFVFPSLYEGYGMPVLEARSCGTRVVASDIPELREAGGRNVTYVQPTFDGIRAGILEVMGKPRQPEDMADRPTWEKGAGALAEIIRGLGPPA